MKNKKILIVGSQHGDEYSGERLYAHILRNHPSFLDFVMYEVGNPEARKLQKRFIESDMNRSFGAGEATYERERAAEIVELINKNEFDLVLDMHTTTVEQPPCLILGDITDKNEPFVRATSFEHIAIMGDVAKNALTGNCPQSVAIEVYMDISEELLELICQDIERYMRGETSGNVKNVYSDIEPFQKSEVAMGGITKLKNFEKSKQGYYPIMIGERSYQDYTDYIGFKAYKRNKFKV